MKYNEYLKSEEWKELRKKAIDRDDGKCVFCNRRFREVHHVTYPKRFSLDHIDNLLVVCEKCHRRLHGIRNDDKELLEVIRKRINIKPSPKNITEYVGVDMSATHGYPMEDCMMKNFNFFKNTFGDYLPNMTIDNFKLFSWKGSIGWVEDERDNGNIRRFLCDNDNNTIKHHCFLCWNSEDIIHWIIKIKWGKNT